MAKSFGVPYQGSKSKIAEWVVGLLPPAAHLYDLMAGGCAVSHCAMLSGKYKEVHVNDITDSVVLFRDALEGRYDNESRWINREDFFRLKDSDPFVRVVWSFGNDQKSYLYSREIEPYKKAVHEMLYAPTPNERRLKFREVIRELARLGVISCKSDASAPPFITHNQAEEAKQRLLSVSSNVCKPQKG